MELNMKHRRALWGSLVAHVRRSSTTVLTRAILLQGQQGHARNESGAEILFQAGRDAMARGDLEQACQKFNESNDVGPAPGTVLNLGNCEEKRGRIATAWEYFTQAMGMLEPGDPRYAVAQRRAQALEKRVPRLLVELSPNAPSTTRAYRSGSAITAFGQPLRLDPGSHTITAEAGGYSGGKFTVTLAEREVEKLVVYPGKRLALPLSRTTTASDQNANLLPMVILGTGAISAIGAGVLGGLSYVRWTTVQKHCDLNADPHRCDDKGLNAQSQGKTMGILAASLGIVAVASAVLYLTLPSGESTTTIAAGQFEGFSGVSVSGDF
jgi:tetratricopeptide (TPR) repeat protein